MQLNILRATILMAVFAALGCNKGKSNQAVVEEVPAAASVDSATAMTEEPTLQSVEGDMSGKAPATFHPSGGGFSENGRFVVQLAVFKSRKQADNLVEKLKGSDFPAYVASVEDPTPELSGTWYRVRVGNFSTAKEARNFGEGTLRDQGHDFWVDNKSNDHKAIAVSEEGTYSAPAASSYTEPAAGSYSDPAPSYTAPVEPPPTPSEPVGVPEPPPPATEPPPQDAWGTPATDGTAPVPSASKDTADAIEGW